MKRLYMATAAVVAIYAMTTCSGKAASEEPTVTTLYKGRWWKTEYISSNSGGMPMCLTVGQWNFANGAIGQGMLKYSTNLGLFIHISKSNWKFAAKNIEVPMSITMDAGIRHGTAYTYPSDGRASAMLQINIQKEWTADFIRDFAATHSLVITFKSGNEPPWKAEMAGSAEAAQALLKCIAYLDANNTSPAPNASSPVPNGATPKASSPVAGKGEI